MGYVNITKKRRLQMSTEIIKRAITHKTSKVINPVSGLKNLF